MMPQAKVFIKTVAAAAIVTINGACFAENGMQDIRGFSHGMSFAEAGQVAKDNQSRCVNFSREVIPYGIRCEGFTFWFSQVIDKAPLMLIYMELRTTSSTPEIVQSLSDQFGKESKKLPPENGFPAEFGRVLGEGKLLRFRPDGSGLIISTQP